MAALGTVPVHDDTIFQPTLLPISDYNVSRGRPLGAVVLYNNQIKQPTLVPSLTGYVVRQIRVLFRQLWPARGQRFPQ